MASEGLLYVVGLTVDPAQESAFNRYYHGEHAPAALAAVPELESVRRYEQYGVDGSLRWYSRTFLTIYEASPDADAERWSAQGLLPAEHPAMASWGSWRERALGEVTRHVYREVFRHPRTTWDGPFGSRPMFVVTVEMARSREVEFRDWYHGEYLPRNVAEVPTWAACRRYEAVAGDPRRSMVVYEAWDEAGLARSLASMRSATRLEENLEWHRWEPSISFQDAVMFRPILRIP